MSKQLSLEKCYTAYINRAELKSSHTLEAYSRSVEVFFDFLADRKDKDDLLPIQLRASVTPQQLMSMDFSPEDLPIFERFASWLLSPGSESDKRPYAPATVELRVAGVLHWFQFMSTQGWLSDNFDFDAASNRVRTLLKSQRSKEKKVASPIEDMDKVITYYDTQQPPKSLQKPDVDAARLARWEVKRLRNSALLYCLAETGGRISELLNLNTDIFDNVDWEKTKRIKVNVVGKGRHQYQIQLEKSLPALLDYLRKRQLTSNSQPLFISHDPRYEGNRMSRIVAWRVVRRAAQAVGIGEVSPHEFRHWRAMQLIEQGHSLETVKTMLGHRSIETVRTLYAHLKTEDEVSS